MRLTFSTIEVTEWNYDDTVFTGGHTLSLKTTDEIYWQTLTRVSKDIPVGFVGLKWFYKIHHNGKVIVSLIADEFWLANWEDRSNDNEELDSMIIESYKRFAGEFDKRKMDLGIMNGLPIVDRKDAPQIRQDVLKFLKTKGI